MERALDMCAHFSSTTSDIDACSAGVFMEYNFNSIEDPESNYVRKLDGNGLDWPCGAVPEPFRKDCYFEQPRWWESLYKSDYIKVGNLCEEVKDEVLRKVCFFGVGGSHLPDVDWTIDACAHMPNREALLLCRAGAAWRFSIEPLPAVHDAYPLVCKGLTQEETKHCLAAGLLQ